jgi:hypothetical protein
MELREHEGRLVCDSCGGMLMSVADFAAAILDLGGQAVTLRLGSAGGAACPRCDRLLRQAALVVDGKDVDGAVDACEHHGVWFAAGALEHAFMVIGRRTSNPSPGRGKPLRGVGLGDGAAAMRFVTARESRAAGATMRPRTRTPFRPGFATGELRCPRCAAVLQLDRLRWTCADHGAFVEHAAFAEMVAEMTRQVWDAVWNADAAAGGPCPACGEAMRVEEKAERCPSHGLWFDGGKLEDALGELTRPRRGWLARLFR